MSRGSCWRFLGLKPKCMRDERRIYINDVPVKPSGDEKPPQAKVATISATIKTVAISWFYKFIFKML